MKELKPKYNHKEVEEGKYQCSLWLVDYDDEEYLEIRLNPKQEGDIQQGIHYKSQLYKLIAGIMETIQQGWSQDHNVITRINLSEFREYLANKETMVIEIREESFTNAEGDLVNYYPFEVTEIV